MDCPLRPKQYTRNRSHRLRHTESEETAPESLVVEFGYAARASYLEAAEILRTAHGHDHLEPIRVEDALRTLE